MNNLNDYLNNTANQGIGEASTNGGPRPKKKGRGQISTMPNTTDYLAGMGASTYDENVNNDDYLSPTYSYDSPYDTNEIRATKQSGWDKAGKGVARVGAKVLTEIAKMPGYLGGIPLALAADEGEGWEALTNNAWIKTLNNVGEHVNDEYLPVYVKKAVSEGNLWDNISSVDFWATEGADGVGYIASMMVPGAAMKMLGVGSKLAKIPGLAGKVSANTADIITTTLANTLMESSAEAGGAMENFQKKMDLKLRAGEISYDDYLKTDEQKALLGRDIFIANTAILLGPNAMQSTLLYGAKGKNAINLFGGNKNLYNATSGALEVTDRTAKKRGLNVIKDVLTGGTPEAWEELSQSTVESLFSEHAEKGKLNSGFLGILKDTNLSELSSAYLDTMLSTDGQKAMFLGFILGAPMTLVQNTKERNRQFQEDVNLVSRGNTAIEAYHKINDFTDMYLEDGSPNYPKMFEKIKSLEALDSMNAQLQMAIANNDKGTVRKLQDIAARQLAFEFIANEEKGLPSLEAFLNSSDNIEELQQLKESNPEMAQEVAENKNKVLKLAKDAQGYRQDFIDFSETLLDSTIKEQIPAEFYDIFKARALDAYIAKNLEVDAIQTELDELISVRERLNKTSRRSKPFNVRDVNTIFADLDNKRLNNSETITDSEKTELDELIQAENLNKAQENKFKDLDLQIKDLTELYEQAEKALSNFWSDEQLVKEFKDIQKQIEATNEALNEEVAEQAETTIQQNNQTIKEQIAEINNSTYEELQEAQKTNKYNRANEQVEVAFFNRMATLQPFPDDMDYSEQTFDGAEIYQAEVNTIHSTSKPGDVIDESTQGLNGTVEVVTPISVTIDNRTNFIDTTDVSSADVTNTLQQEVDDKKKTTVNLGDKAITPGFGTSEYYQYLSNRKDKVGDGVTFSLNTFASTPQTNPELKVNVDKALEIYNKALNKNPITDVEKNILIEYLPIQFNYVNDSFSFSAFPGNVNRMYTLRTMIVNNVVKGIPLENMGTTIVGQNRGDIVSEKELDGSPKKNRIIDLPFVKEDLQGDISKLSLYHVNKKGEIIKITKGSEIDTTYTVDIMDNIIGQIFLAMPNNRGGVVPLKLNISKLEPSQALIIAKLYSEILKNPDLRKNSLGFLDSDSNPKGQMLLDEIEKTFKAELDLLGGDVDTINTQEFIELLVLEGSSTFGISEGITLEGKNYITYGEQDYFLNDNESIQRLGNSLTNKTRNIQTVLHENSALKFTFEDENYLKYLLDNNILTTDVKISEPIKLKSENGITGSELYLDNYVSVADYSEHESHNTVESPKQVEENPEDSPEFKKHVDKLITEYYNKISEYRTKSGAKSDEFFKAPRYAVNPKTGLLQEVDQNSEYNLGLEQIIRVFNPKRGEYQPFKFQDYLKNKVENSALIFWKNQNNSVSLQNQPTINNTVETPSTNPKADQIMEEVKKEITPQVKVDVDLNIVNEEGLNYNELENKVKTLEKSIENTLKNLEVLPEARKNAVQVALQNLQQTRNKLVIDMKNIIDKSCS